MAAHRYWRLLLSSFPSGGGNPGAGEIEFRASIGGADETGSGTALSSGDYSASYSKNYAFDDNASTEWASNVSTLSWIGYDFGAGNDVDIVEVYLKTRIAGDYGVNNYDLQYSDDGTNWVTKYFWRGLTPFTGFGQTRVTSESDQPETAFDVPPRRMAGASFLPMVVSQSSFYSGYPGYKAFEVTLGAYWISNDGAATGWIKYDFGAGNAIQINSYDLVMPSGDTIGRAPKDWTLLGSNDDSAWDTIDTVTNETGWSYSESRSFTCDSPGSYRYYKLNVTANNGGGNYIIIGEWKLYTTIVAAAAYSLAAGSGSFAETGTAAGLRATRLLSAGSGSFAETGTAAALELGRKMAALSGSFVLSGTAAGLRATRLLSAASGAFEETGFAASLIYVPAGVYSLDAGAGIFNVSGAAAGLRATRILVSGSGAFLESGTAAGLFRGYKVAALPGAFALTGTAVDFLYNRLLSAGPGAFTLTMTLADLIYTAFSEYVLEAGSGTFLISGGVVYFPRPGASRTCYIFQKRRDHFRT